MLTWIKTHPNKFSAIIVGIVLLVIALFSRGWWGTPALGTLIGCAVYLFIYLIVDVVARNRKSNIWSKAQPWVLMVAPFVIALIVWGLTSSMLVNPIQLRIPAVPDPKSIALILFAVFMLLLVIGFVRALRGGERVGIESHWGGLGGGISGFQVSTPLIYLLGIIFLLAVASAVAWRAYPPPSQPATQQQVPQQPSITPTPAATAVLQPSPSTPIS